MQLAGGDGPVRVSHDDLDRPHIEARSWTDAALGLGWSVASHRRSQMDLMARRSHGRLAAALGPAALGSDVRQRVLGLREVALACWHHLPRDQQRLLESFADGVDQAGVGDAPADRWTPVHSIAVAQLLFQSLTSDGSEHRMVEVMRRTLPVDVVRFLLPDRDEYETDVDGSAVAVASQPGVDEQLRSLMSQPPSGAAGRMVVTGGRPVGSNAWAVSRHGSALLANDMHMELTHPSLWYAVRMSVPGGSVAGVTVPGLPMLVSGTNGAVAWGFTRLPADVVDLREVASGESGEIRRETIEVRGDEDVVVTIRHSPWGPVVGELAGREVAFDSTLLDPTALDFGLTRIYGARNVHTACAVVNDAGLPPLNVVVADSAGSIGWTVGGRFPQRPESGPRGLAGGPKPARMAPSALPRVIDPPSGHVISCNNGGAAVRTAGLGWNFFTGVRARRVATLLAGAGEHDERAAARMQLDVDADLYRFYQSVALRYLPAAVEQAALRELREEIGAWDGTAAPGARGLPLLVAFRDLLREELIGAVTRPCQLYDPEFTYCYHGHERPLRRLVAALERGVVPAPWPSSAAFVVAQLQAARALVTRQGDGAPVRWGQVNRLSLVPLTTTATIDLALGDLELPGCPETVCVAQPDFGAAMRLVVDPSRPGQGLVGIPGSACATPERTRHQIQRWLAGRNDPLEWCS